MCSAVRLPSQKTASERPSGSGHQRLGSQTKTLVAAPLELELADDDLVQQADHVRAGADQIAGILEGLLQRAGAAELLPPLEHQRPPPRAGQIGRRGQPVVAAADDDRIPVSCRERGYGLREADAAEHGVDVDHPGQANAANEGPLAKRSVDWGRYGDLRSRRPSREAMERAARESATITYA